MFLLLQWLGNNKLSVGFCYRVRDTQTSDSAISSHHLISPIRVRFFCLPAEWPANKRLYLSPALGSHPEFISSVWNPLASVPVCPFPMRSIRFTWRVGRAASNLGDARDRIEHFGALKRTKLVPLREPEVLTRAHQHPDSNRWQPAQKSIQATLIHLFAHFDPCHNIANLGCNTSQPIVAPVTISLRA